MPSVSDKMTSSAQVLSLDDHRHIVGPEAPDIEPTVCSSISDFIYQCEEKTEGWKSTWYRGVRKRFPLVPKKFRAQRAGDDTPKEYRDLDEVYLVETIGRKYPLFHDRRLEKSDILCLTQHLGFPTRLLDWTETLANAVYFAVPGPEADPHIALLNPIRFNALQSYVFKNELKKSEWHTIRPDDIDEIEGKTGIYYSDGGIVQNYMRLARQKALKVPDDKVHTSISENDGLELPVCFVPNYLNDRQFLQQSCFTIAGTLGNICLRELLKNFSQQIVSSVFCEIRFSNSEDDPDDPFLPEKTYKLREMCPSAVQLYGDEYGLFQDTLDALIWAPDP